MKFALALSDPKQLAKGIDKLAPEPMRDNGHGTRHDMQKPVTFQSNKWWE